MSSAPLDLATRLAIHGVEAEPRGIWSSVGTPDQAYGWKIHLSSIPVEAQRLLDSVLPDLVEYGFPFKVAHDINTLVALNGGEFGDTQVGKFITIYPPTPHESRRMGSHLARATRQFSGPRIVTDLHIGGVAYTRYGEFNPPFVRDRLGHVRPDSTVGMYTVPFSPPEGIANPFDELVETNETPQDEGPLRPIGPGYLLTGRIQSHAKGAVFSAIDLRVRESIEPVILKEGRAHCMSDREGRDIRDRLAHQAALHRRLAGLVPIASAGSIFVHNGNTYLPLQHLDGTTLAARAPVAYAHLDKPARATLLRHFDQLVDAIGELHRWGVVHRDISPRNVLTTKEGALYLLDLEFSYELGTKIPPFAGGTVGFSSPQQLAGDAPSSVDDVYSVGCTLAYALAGMDARCLIYGNVGISERLEIVSGAPASLCQVIGASVHPEPAERPTLGQIRKAIRDSGPSSERASPKRHARSSPSYDRHLDVGLENDLPNGAAVVFEALEWIVVDAPRSMENGLWLSEALESVSHPQMASNHRSFRSYRSAGRGVSGVVYAIARLHGLGFQSRRSERIVSEATDWLLNHEPTADDQMPGLHYGEAGVAVALCEAVRVGLVPSGPWLGPYLSEALSGPLDWPDLTHGAAGQGMAAFACSDALEDRDLAVFSHRCAQHLLDTQSHDGSWAWPEGVRGMAGTAYTGVAHGTAGVVAFLSEHANRFGSGDSLAAAERGAAWLIATMRTNDDDASINWRVSSNSESTWSWWCHGAPGIALAFLALYRLTENPEYASIARSALRSQLRNNARSNLSQCHGLSGLGEIYLESFRVLGDAELRDQALGIATRLLALAHRQDGMASWRVEVATEPTADLMVGCGGVAHFLGRILRPDAPMMGMPLMPGMSLLA